MEKKRVVKIYRIVDSPLDDDADINPRQDSHDMEIMQKLLALSSPEFKKEVEQEKKKQKKKKKKTKDKKNKKDGGKPFDLSAFDIFEDDKPKKGSNKVDKNSDDFYSYRFNSSLVLLSNLMNEYNDALKDGNKYYEDLRKGRVKSSPMAITSQMGNISGLLGGKLSVIKEISAVNSKISELEIKKKAADEKSGKAKEAAEGNTDFILDKMYDRILMAGDIPVPKKSGRHKRSGSKKEISKLIDSRLNELENDGDINFTETEKAFKYEKQGVRLIVQKNKNTSRWRFIALNDEDEQLYDYPLPSRAMVGRLAFDNTTMTAKDKTGTEYDVVLVNSFDNEDDLLGGYPEDDSDI